MTTTNTPGHGETETETNAPRRRVGDILRETRIARDEDLGEIAKQLRIRKAFLEALEQSRPQDLPGSTYALGFVRSYAEHLHLNADELVTQFKVEAKELEDQTALHFPEPLPGKNLPGGALLFIGLVLLAVFYGAWWYLNNQGKSISELVPELPESLSRMLDRTDAPQDPAAPTTTQAPADKADTPAVEDEAAAPESRTEQDGVMETAPDAAPEAAPEATEPAEAQPPATETDTPPSEEETSVEPAATEPTASVDTPTGEPPASSEPADATDSTEVAATETASEPDAAPEPEAPVENAAEDTASQGEPAADDAAETADGSIPETADTPTAETAPAPEPDDATDSAEDTETETASADPIPAPPIPESSFSAKVYGEENTDARVVIEAVGSAWVEVSDTDDNLLLTRLLNVGDSYRVPNKSGITLVTGNAGALRVTVDGETIGKLGPSGSVRRDVDLSPDGLKSRLSPDGQ